MLRLSLAALLALACAACAHTLTPRGGFIHTLGQEQPLSGRIWSHTRDALVDPNELMRAVRASEVLLLGETHDNADHHRLQAQLLDAWLTAHPSANVGFEMIDETQAAALAAPSPKSADALALALHWVDTGWPEFALYRPVFEVVLAHGARLFAAHPSREHLRGAMRGVDEAEALALKLEPPLPEPQRAALAQEIRDSHCGQAPDAMIAPMIAAQSFKDAWMARALTDAGLPAALVSGRGHLRRDRGVPTYLARRGITQLLTVAFVDLQQGLDRLEDYELAPYDFVIFTPRVDDASACDRFREQLARMRQGAK